MKRIIAAAMLGALVLSFAAPARATSLIDVTPKDSMFYAVMAHPDDEYHAWSMIQARSDEYVVFVTMTQGEGTFNCRTPEEATEDNKRGGPYSYQGPGSPVGEPNLGERAPLGNPWVGQHSDACKRARIASWHWFLDDMNAADGSGTSFDIVEDPWLDDDYQGRFCPPGHQGQGAGQPIEKRVGCADVWANEEGARIAFDLGNGDPSFDYNGGFDEKDFPPSTFGREEVGFALAKLRSERTSWGMPALPETGMLASLAWNPVEPTAPQTKPCDGTFGYEHPDHRVVTEALRFDDQGAGPQYGPVMCDASPYLEGTQLEAHATDPASLVAANNVDFVTNQRIGPLTVNYGWLNGPDRSLPGQLQYSVTSFGWYKSADLYWKVYD